MGILAETEDEDVRLITWIAQSTEEAWNYYAKNTPQYSDVRVEVNEAVIPGLSAAGDKVLTTYFQKPDLLGKIATLVAVANCCPPFRIRRGNTPESMERRREFFAVLSCTFVQAAFALYKPHAEVGAYVLKFREGGTRERFLAYLKLMDVLEITGWDGKNGRKEAQSVKSLAKDVLAITEFLCSFVHFEHGASYGDIRVLPG